MKNEILIDPGYVDTLINPDVENESRSMEVLGKLFSPVAEAIIHHMECEITVKYLYAGEEVWKLVREK